MVSKTGAIYSSFDGVLEEKAFIMAAELSEEDYNSLIESYGSYYDVEEVEGYKYTANHFQDDSLGVLYDVYFIYNDGLVTQAMFMNTEDSDKNTVLNSLELPGALESTTSESTDSE